MAEEDVKQPCTVIYSVLEACANEQLTPIVEGLLASPVVSLGITRAFERHHPDHVRYTDQIGDEGYRLGRLALAGKDCARPAYGPLVAALCKQIGLPVKADVDSNEALLLSTFAKRHLSSVPCEARAALVTEAGVAAGVAAAGMLSSDSWPPLASFLLKIAYLRRLFAVDARSGSGRTGAEVVVATADEDPEPASGTAVVFRDGGSAPVLSLAQLPNETGSGWRTISDERTQSVLYPLLEAMQPLVAGFQMLRGETLWRANLPVGATLAYSGKMGAHAGVAAGIQGMVGFTPVSVAGLLGPTAFLALAAAMIEQKRLEDMQRSLAEIRSAVEGVSRFQKEERRSVLTGAIRYFRQIAPSVFAGELASEVLQVIEDHEAALVKVQDHLAEDTRDAVEALRGVRKETFGSGKYQKGIQEAQARLATIFEEALLCLRARACGYQLLCAFPGREAGKKARFDDIVEGLAVFSPTGAAAGQMDEALRGKIAGVSSYENKALLLSLEDRLFDDLATTGATIAKGLCDPGRGPADDVPVAVDMRVEDGRVVGMRLA